MSGDPTTHHIPANSSVRLQGLTRVPDLNGALGEVVGPASYGNETDPPRYPVRLVFPPSVATKHPEGVWVRAANLEVLSRAVELPPLTELGRVQSPGVLPMTPGNAGEVAASFVKALEADRYPPPELDGVFGLQMPRGGRGSPEGVRDLRRCDVGSLTLGAWQELMQVLHAERLGAAVRALGGTEQEFGFAMMAASTGGLDALRAMGGPNGHKLAAVIQATRREFTAVLEDALLGGRLPQWFEAGVRRQGAARQAPGGSPYCAELCRRDCFGAVAWDRAALAGLRSASG